MKKTEHKYVVLEIPIIDTKTEPFQQYAKVMDEHRELADAIIADESERRIASEMIDVVQAFVGAIRAQLSAIVDDDGKVVELTQEFFKTSMIEHREKMARYSSERGWE